MDFPKRLDMEKELEFGVNHLQKALMESYERNC